MLESMLVALSHMQVSVCTFQGREDTRTGITRFRKNIISFPQRVSELQQQIQFVSSVVPGDVVNIFTGCAAEPIAASLQRARVCEIRGQDFLVEISGDNIPKRVPRSHVVSRLRLPWKPSD